MDARFSSLLRWMPFEERRRTRVLNTVLLVLFYVLPLGGAVFSGWYFDLISVLYICGIVYFAFCGELIHLYPLFFLFYAQLIAPGGIVVYRVYTLALIARSILSLARRRPSLSLPRVGILLLLAFGALILRLCGYPVAVGAAIDICFACCFLFSLSGRDDTVSVFFVFFTFGVLVSALSGFLIPELADSAVSEEGAEVLRYAGTLEDPNYFGFFLNAAISVVFLHPFFKALPIKLLSLAVLCVALIASGSTTALLCSVFTVIICFFFLIRMKRFKLRLTVTVLVIAVIALQLLMLAQDSEWSFISTASARWQEKLESIAAGELSEFTTARLDIWKENLRKFSEQSLPKKLFGGNFVTAVGYDEFHFNSVSHQEYIDIMMCTGIFGSVFFLACTFFMLRDAVSRIKTSSETACISVALKLIWLFYGFGLTMFLSTRFYILFLI